MTVSTSTLARYEVPGCGKQDINVRDTLHRRWRSPELRGWPVDCCVAGHDPTPEPVVAPPRARRAPGRLRLAAWKTTKASCDGAYHYTLAYTSSTGGGSITKVAIVDDQPTVRRYGGFPGDTSIAPYEETGAQVGTHSQGWPASTMEQLHDTCVDNGMNGSSLTFQADARGVIEHCYSTVKAGCQTDCSAGFNVSEFGCGPLAP
jgi:hypothetical protein